MNTYTLAAKLKDAGIEVFAVHPGVVDTQFSRGYTGIFKAAFLFHKGELMYFVDHLLVKNCSF